MWVSFDTTIYSYLYVYMGRIYFWVALIWKHIYGYIYIWKYLAYNLEPRFSFVHIYLWGWAQMKFLRRYTNTKTCSLTSYVIYERTHVCHRVCR